MPGPSRLELERDAHRAWVELLDQAERVRNLFANAGVSTPDRLRRLLEDEPAYPSKRPAVAPAGSEVCPVHPGPVPPEFKPGSWIVVNEAALSVRTYVLGLLREAGPGGITSRELAEKVKAGREDQNLGSVYNLGGQLEKAGVIRRDDARWILVNEATAPVMSGAAAWGPPDVFSKQEVAAYRREAIRLILQRPGHSNGLQIMQVVRLLKELPWLNAPVAKDVVKGDIEFMQQDRQVKRTGNNRNWALRSQEEP